MVFNYLPRLVFFLNLGKLYKSLVKQKTAKESNHFVKDSLFTMSSQLDFILLKS